MVFWAEWICWEIHPRRTASRLWQTSPGAFPPLPGRAVEMEDHPSTYRRHHPILIWVYPRIYLTLTAISHPPTLHLAWFKAPSFSKQTLLLSFSTCIFHVFFGRPHFLLPFTSNSNAFLKTCPSSLLNTCLYHTPLASHKFTFSILVFFFKNTKQ